MPNQSLVDLTERTATADSDLIHVNSGGSDYKQTKKNFTFDLVQYHEFNNTDSLTSQCDYLALSVKSPAYYVGKINSYGHQSATGVPFNNSYHVQLSIYSGSYVELTLMDVDDGGVFRKIKANGTWQSSWTMQPTRAEITSLNNSLTKYYDAPAVASVTIGSSGYTELSRPSAVVGKHTLAISVLNWSTASGAFNAAILRDNGTRYMIYGTPNVTITNLELRWVFQD